MGTVVCGLKFTVPHGSLAVLDDSEGRTVFLVFCKTNGIFSEGIEFLVLKESAFFSHS